MGIAQNLTFYARLNEVLGNRRDSRGGLTGTDVNTVGSAAGLIGTAAEFVAANTESLNFGTSGPTGGGLNSWTWTAWVRFADANSAGAGEIIVARDATNQRAYALDRVGGTNNIRWSLFKPATTQVATFTVALPAQPAWTFLEFGYNAGAGTFGTAFLKINNGIATATVCSSAPVTSSANVVLGNRDLAGGGPLNARMQLVSHHTRLLTSDESALLYNGGAGKVIAMSAGGTPLALLQKGRRRAH